MRALYVGYNNTENHGDEALEWIVRDLLAPELDVRRDWTEYEVAVLGGGTLINQSPWLIDYFESALNRASIGGIVMGSGVGDLGFWGNTFDRWVPLLKRCRLVGVRGPESQRLLVQHGYNSAVVCGDPYLWLRSPVQRDAHIPKRLGVNLGSTNDSLWGTSDAAITDEVTGALKQLAARGWSFTFFSVWSRDLPILQRVAEACTGEDGRAPLVLDARSDTLECYSALAACELFLGEKLHACAMAAVAEVPFIAMEYQPKVRDFAESLDMQQWCISTAEVNTDRLVEMIESLQKERERVVSALSDVHNALRSRLVHFSAEAKSQLLAAGRQPR